MALVLLGVFCPSLSLQMQNWSLVAAIMIVLLLWFVVFVFRSRAGAVAFGQGLGTIWTHWTTKKEVTVTFTESPPHTEATPEAPKSEGGASHE